MRHFFLSVLSILILNASFCMAEPVKIIFDTDMGNDIDDAMALAVAHSLQSRGELEILAVTTTKDNPYAVRMVDVLNTFYGRGNIPIGVVQNGVTPEVGKYNQQVVDLKSSDGKPAFARTYQSDEKFPEAVSLIRKVLAAQDDQSVVLVQLGFFTNLQRLLETPGDEYSPLSGKELVVKKVKYASIMAGVFAEQHKEHQEYNVVKDLPAARTMIEHWPTEIIFSGWEIGYLIDHSLPSINKDFSYVPCHPVQEGYRFYRGLDKKQSTFDLNSVLYAARPDRGYYTLSEPGTVRFDEVGRTVFNPEPNGKHRYQKVDATQIAVVREALALLTSEPPKK